MERIKNALEMASRERLQHPKGESRSDGTQPIQASPDSIEYTETRRVEVSDHAMRENHLLTTAGSGPFLDAFKLLRTQVLQRMDEHGWNALAVTSTRESEGKTLVSINLALSLAREVERTVLLVDASLKHPSVHTMFGQSDMPGLTEYLLDNAPLPNLLFNPAGIGGFIVLPGGRRVENSSELLSSPRMGRLVEELKNRYPQRLVVFDLPPVLATSDALAFSPFVDAALLVIGEGDAPASDVQRAASMLETTNLIGTVLNRAWGVG